LRQTYDTIFRVDGAGTADVNRAQINERNFDAVDVYIRE